MISTIFLAVVLLAAHAAWIIGGIIKFFELMFMGIGASMLLDLLVIGIAIDILIDTE